MLYICICVYMCVYLYVSIYSIFTARCKTANARTQTFCAAQRGSRPQINTDLHHSERMLRSPEGAPHSWRSLHIHPNENVRRDIPREQKQELCEQPKVFDRIRSGVHSNLDRLFESSIVPQGSESLRLKPRITLRSGSGIFSLSFRSGNWQRISGWFRFRLWPRGTIRLVDRPTPQKLLAT